MVDRIFSRGREPFIIESDGRITPMGYTTEKIEGRVPTKKEIGKAAVETLRIYEEKMKFLEGYAKLTKGL